LLVFVVALQFSVAVKYASDYFASFRAASAFLAKDENLGGQSTPNIQIS
jgi:hypothetical protein